MDPLPDAVMLFARVARFGGALAHHRVLSLSRTCMNVAAAGTPLLVGEPVTVTLGRIDRATGDVTAVHGGIAAITFRHPVDCAAARLSPRGRPRRPSRSAWLAAIEGEVR